jgi:hypothetical protein
MTEKRAVAQVGSSGKSCDLYFHYSCAGQWRCGVSEAGSVSIIRCKRDPTQLGPLNS